MSVEVGSLAALEPILDALPTPLVLVEPGSARVLHANPAAAALAPGAEILDRAARGERLEQTAVESGGRSLAVSARPVSIGDEREAILVTLEDVSELAHARRRTALLAEAGAHLGGSLHPGE